MVLNGSENPNTPMKKKISISIDEKLLDGVDKLAEGVEYSSRSHVIEVAVSKLLIEKTSA